MIDKNKIAALVENFLEGSDKFLVDINIKPGNHIYVFLDSDREITISDCAEVSKYIESNLDRDIEDFDLRVSSAGIDQPYKLLRQYKKNIGRKVKVLLTDGKTFTGMLLSVSDDKIELKPDRKKQPKKDIGEDNTLTLGFNKIKETKGIVTFK